MNQITDEYSSPQVPARGTLATDWQKSIPDNAWTHLTVRDGEKGPVEIEIRDNQASGTDPLRAQTDQTRGVVDRQPTTALGGPFIVIIRIFRLWQT